MSIVLARGAFAELGRVSGEITLLAEGMSSQAWVGLVDGTETVVRVPRVRDDGPTPTYRSECAINRHLQAAGAPGVDLRVIELDGVVCTAATRVPGNPVRPDEWSEPFVTDVARALRTAHGLPVTGWGPPVDDDGPLRGTCPDGAAGAAARFWRARIWPFDDTSLRDHPAAAVFPERIAPIAELEPAIREEAERTQCLVHTDLHPDHLLRDQQGQLSAILDFGDAFIGSPAWDLACLRYYHGATVTDRVTDVYGEDDDLPAGIRLLGVAFALYKLDKTPTRTDVIERVESML